MNDHLIDLEHICIPTSTERQSTANFELNANIGFQRNKVSALLGHNGAGKTTLIRSILGIIKPQSGAVEFNNEILSHKNRAEIGYMPEVNKLPAKLTPEEILFLQLSLCNQRKLSKKEKKLEVQQKLEQIGLTEIEKKRFSSYPRVWLEARLGRCLHSRSRALHSR